MYWSDISNNLVFLINGLMVTLKLAGLSIAGSLIFGIILGVLRYSKIFPLNIISTFLIEVIRSIPLILFIVFIHFGFLPYVLGISSNFFQSACVALIVFTSAYVAEIIRGGLSSVESSYIDAGKSLGLSDFRCLIYIILPIAITRMLPALVNQFVTLIKDTSLASTIGLIEFTRSGEIIYERTYHELEILLFIALIYFLICFTLSSLVRTLEFDNLFSTSKKMSRAIIKK